jgi:hypothetical protein
MILYKFYSIINKNSDICSLILFLIKEDEMGRARSTNGGKRNAYRILVGNPEGKRPLGRPRCILER